MRSRWLPEIQGKPNPQPISRHLRSIDVWRYGTTCGRVNLPPLFFELERKEQTMLILTRRVGETVMIGDSVTVTILGVKGNQVRVGVNAPKEIAVHREEIYERIKREEQAGGGAARRPITGANP